MYLQAAKEEAEPDVLSHSSRHQAERETAKWKKGICWGTETRSVCTVNQSCKHGEDRGEAGRQYQY